MNKYETWLKDNNRVTLDFPRTESMRYCAACARAIWAEICPTDTNLDWFRPGGTYGFDFTYLNAFRYRGDPMCGH